jgi:hypothetical protein
MPSNAVKFIYGATTVNFNANEVLDIIWDNAQQYQVHDKQSASPNVKYIGNNVSTLNIIFDLQESDTEDRIDQILAAGVELTCYYALLSDAAATIKVIPLFDGIEEIWLFGHEAANISKSITFLQSGT